MPATKAYPNGALVPSDKKTPETRPDRDSTKISGPSAAGEDRIPPATASTRTAALIPAANQTRAGRRDASVVVTGRPVWSWAGRYRGSGWMADSNWPPSAITGPPWLTIGPGTAPHLAWAGNSR